MRLIPSSRGGLIARFAIGAAIVIMLTAATTAVAGLLQVKQAAVEISATPAIPHARVTIADPGNPQTILIVGSDHRAGAPFRTANTDTMILVRLDPSSSTINVLSVPRDLQVDIPERGTVVTAKLNSAYSAGGTNLLVKVLEQDVFPELQVNHIVDVNFSGFDALVNAIGCVYTDVDHRYYNNTNLTDYSSIDLQPGYQKLCGPEALSFVRFRHTDNDIVRNARQQDFIRWAKDQYGPAQLIANRDKLLGIFGHHAQTDPDLHKTDGLINLFNLVAFSAGHAIKQIPFPAVLQPCAPAPRVANRSTPQTPCYVTADPAAEERAFQAFMTPTKTPTKAAAGTAGSTGTPNGASPPPKAPSLIGDRGDGTAQAAALGPVAMPVYFPRRIAAGSAYCSGLTGNCPVETASPGSYPR
ncbi:MAG: LytR family transcriptional regulator, partial [Solirubrobacterales bacterium]